MPRVGEVSRGIIGDPGNVFTGSGNGIFPLAGAIERYPHSDLVLYNRVSAWDGAGYGKRLLHEKTDAVEQAIRRMFPDSRIMAKVDGIEEGKQAVPRKHLLRARDIAQEHKGILVASDTSRLLRGKGYHRKDNRMAEPTPSEWKGFHKWMNVPMATVAPPDLTEDQRHSLATRRTGKAGRPRVEDVDPDLPIRIFAEVGMIRWVETRRGRGWGQLRSYWTPPLAVLSKWFHVSPATILKLLDIPSPAGPTWREIFQDKREVFECSIWSPSRDYKDGLAEVEE